jgi:pimeloyl-ACP methyl ester carboxylesterase
LAAYVLVHGGWRGGWVWTRVAKRLRQDGHDVFTPTMTGLGERSHLLNAGVNLSTNILDIVNLMHFEALDNIVLCGHSYAGMVISGVADQIGDRIASLVYLNAWLPEDGDSILSLLPEEAQIATIKDAGRFGGHSVPPIPPEVFRVNERDRAWVDQMCTHHPLATMTEAIALKGDHLQVKKKTFVLATAWEPNPFRRFYEQVGVDAGWSRREIESGHDAMLDNPEAVTALLLEAAVGVPQDRG